MGRGAIAALLFKRPQEEGRADLAKLRPARIAPSRKAKNE